MISSSLISIFKYLQNPQLVASFQKFCGIKAIHKHNNETSHNGVNGNETNGMENTQSINVMHINGCSNDDTNGKYCNPVERDICTNGFAHKDDLNDPHNQEILKDKRSSTCIKKNYFVHAIFHLGSALGNEVFYTLFFSCCFWNIDAFVGRRICMFWAVYMYLGQATKDFLKVPRPASPPVVRLEKRYELEYGLPSTHAMTGIGLPISILLYTFGRYEYNAYSGVILCVSWSLLVGLSRVYLGMHSILDILAGYAYILLITPFFIPLLECSDKYLIDWNWSPVLLIVLVSAIMYFYPKSETWNSARGDTALCLGIAAGVIMGHWIAFRQGLMVRTGFYQQRLRYPINDASSDIYLFAFLRQITGLIVLIIVRLFMKNVSIFCLSTIFGLDWKLDSTRKLGKIEVPYKLITYFSMAMHAVITIPLIFLAFGIERSDFRSEL